MMKKVVRQLILQHYTIATAESITGGLLASQIVSIPGVSAIFQEGYVCYSIASKQKILGIEEELFSIHDVVSEEIALAMAKRLYQKTNASIVLATTGLAGPSGGSYAKPVGTVCIAIGIHQSYTVQTLHLRGGRQRIRQNATKAIWKCLWNRLRED